MSSRNQHGWVAWSLSAILAIATASVAWLYFDVNSQLQARDAELRQAQSRLTQAERNLQREIDSRENLATSQSALQSEINQLKSQVTATEQELAQQKLALNNALAERGRYEQMLNDDKARIEALETQLAAIESQREALESELNENETQLTEYQSNIENLRGQLSEAATTEELYLAAREQLALEQAENETYSETIEKLQQEMAQEAAAMASLEDSLQSQLTELNREKEKLVTQLEDGTTAIKLPESILFASGSAELNEDGLKTLKALGDALQSFPNHRISLQGHTDSRTIAKNTALVYPTNWELSSARAAAAVRALLSQGLPPEQMQAVGLADTQPLVKEVDAKTRAQNRRIEVILFPNQFTTKVLEEIPDSN